MLFYYIYHIILYLIFNFILLFTPLTALTFDGAMRITSEIYEDDLDDLQTPKSQNLSSRFCGSVSFIHIFINFNFIIYKSVKLYVELGQRNSNTHSYLASQVWFPLLSWGTHHGFSLPTLHNSQINIDLQLSQNIHTSNSDNFQNHINTASYTHPSNINDRSLRWIVS